MTAAVQSLSSLGAAALAYATRLKWAVFPLRGKIPAIAGGQGCLDATTDPAQIRAWWEAMPAANIGLATGAISGIVVIDLDGPDAERIFTERYGNPPTPSSLTGRGRHLLFAHPGGVIPNSAGRLGVQIDVRGDGGYVVAPPSVHPETRKCYAWERDAGMHPLVLPPAPMPPQLVSDLREVAQASGSATGSLILPASDIPGLSVIGAGERNQTLTRYAGRLIAKGHSAAETYELLVGINVAKVKPPLHDSELRTIITSLSKREARKPARVTSTGTTLAVAAEVTEAPALNAEQMAAGQITAAIARGRRDTSADPRWDFSDLDELVGPMMPGQLWIVGALPSNGKTALMFSQMAAMAEFGVPVVYLPLEMDPDDLRRRWAAWHLGLDQELVALNAWDQLPLRAREEHEAALLVQRDVPVHFPPDRRVTVSGLGEWARWGVEEVGARIVVVDHFHRMAFGGGGDNYRVAVSESVRTMKDIAREHGIVLVATAQLNGDGDPFDRYFPPLLRRLKESAALGEEADVVLMLSRILAKEMTKEEITMVRNGWSSARDFALPNVMQVTCRKHRLADARAGDRSVRLAVVNGRVKSRTAA